MVCCGLGKPFLWGYQSLKRLKRNKSYYQGARSNRYDFKYKINRFIEDNQRPVYAGVALAVLAVVAFTVTSFIPNGTPSGVNTSSAQALQAPEASEKVSVEALKASSAVAELNGQLDGESQELAQEMSEEDILYEKLMTGMEMTAAFLLGL